MPVCGFPGGAFDEPTTKKLTNGLAWAITLALIFYVTTTVVYITSSPIRALRGGNLEVLKLSQKQEELLKDADFDLIVIGSCVINLICFVCIVVGPATFAFLLF